ncbi:MAG TPA: alpha-glucan family phosphorylase, partial [Gemmatimonadaceae bacterium]|nr:alpha-glucan family phosphorylase [Gemmatimonadaceae bacterium]
MSLEWQRIPYLPPRIEGLGPLALNLSWSWSRSARTLFSWIDEPLWHFTRHNPLMLLRRVHPERLGACSRDPSFLALYDRIVAKEERNRSSEGTWFHEHYADLIPGTGTEGSGPVAYFCAEFGLHNSVPIYSGGLGVLAGDHCKAASDAGIPLVGIGLFYRKGYFDQRLRLDGWQEDSDELFNVSATPLEQVFSADQSPWLTVLRTAGRDVHIGAWRMMVGRVPVYLLDTNLPQNDPEDRELASKLYAGGPELRIKQEWILGVGGVRVLRAVGLHPTAWHANEGHAAFMLIERLRELIDSGMTADDAARAVRARSIFTTHTPVPAGHDRFSNELVETTTGPIWDEMGITREAFFDFGRHPTEHAGEFHMSVCAVRLSDRVNGVARRHGDVSRELFHVLWPHRPVEQVPIGAITNGVHLATWMCAEVMGLLDRHLGPDWGKRLDDAATWEQVLDIDDADFWHVHRRKKRELMGFIREQARRRFTRQWKEAAHVVGAGTLLDPDAMTIGFARRFATYKRADLIFRDLDRLRDLITSQRRPVQLLFAGKAHPSDNPGKEVLQTVYRLTRDPSLEGRVAFLEDYDMHVAHRLVEGVDLWMNLPRVPLEASGTSGMKAGLNGVPQLSTLDGWWAEGFDGQNGWVIPDAAPETDADTEDVERLYVLLERHVVPLFYQRDERGVPTGWVEKMKHALRVSGSRFTARRMIHEYGSEYYAPAMRGEGLPDATPTA